MEKLIYKIAIDGEGSIYIEGPTLGGQCSFYGGFLHPETRFTDKITAQKTVVMMNRAHAKGYAKAQSDIQKSLGIKK